MSALRRIGSASPFEERFGFCRALRIAERILVSGTAPIENDGSSTVGDAGVQADRCFALIHRAIAELGGSPQSVVRTRMYLVDMTDAELVGASHERNMRAARPVATMVAVSQLCRPEWKVEIEAEAIVDGE